MTHQNAFAAVIFDMDGLMFDTERLAIETYQQAAKTQGFEFPEALLLEVIGRNTQDTQKILEESMHADFDFTQTYALNLAFSQKHIEEHGVPIKPGLFALLETLENAGIKKAVATSTPTAQAQALLTRAGILPRFDAIICGDQVPRGKPEPDIFLLAACHLQADPQTCIVLEDSENGIRAAYAARMMPFWLPDLKQLPDDVLAMTAHRFTSLQEVADFIGNNGN